jgi:hypothetical protein
LNGLKALNAIATNAGKDGLEGFAAALTFAGKVLFFERQFALEDVIGSHACSLEALACV